MGIKTRMPGFVFDLCEMKIPIDLNKIKNKNLHCSFFATG